MSRNKRTIGGMVVNLTQAEKETLAVIVKEADIARLGKSKKSFRDVFREEGAKHKGKVKRLCSILAKEKTDSEKVMNTLFDTLMEVA